MTGAAPARKPLVLPPAVPLWMGFVAGFAAIWLIQYETKKKKQHRREG